VRIDVRIEVVIKVIIIGWDRHWTIKEIGWTARREIARRNAIINNE
jgi:hypothetical protein